MNTRKQLKLLVLSLTLVISMFGVVCRSLLHVADATFVEGAIVQDTIWTLVDSPFVLSNDVVVYPNATLTIEPDVSVRFGGSFSLSVEGRLTANGEEDKTIKFSSNKDAPQPGDWGTISFTGPQLSTLTNCNIEHGTNGISIQNSNLDIRYSNISRCSVNGILAESGQLLVQNCNISLCFQNGINVTNSQITARNNLISQNKVNGIFVSGVNNAVIQDNMIIANDEGIAISGNAVSGVNLEGNVVAANTEDGILFDADVHSSIVISSNTVSSNKNGICVSTLTGTYLTNNAIAYNTANGFLYQEGNHTAYHNDIYGNVVGMDANASTFVNAEYNYWGDSSGPYNVSLNPTGRGDPVAGSGANIDFVFFLTKPSGHINVKPMAMLMTDKTLTPRNQAVMFFGTESTDEGHVDRYYFDFGDGNSSGWTTLSTFTHEYSSVGTYYANLTVMDDFGAVSDRIAVAVSVQNLLPLMTTVDASKTSVNEGEQVTISVYVSDGTNAVENATVTLFSVREGEFSPSTGLTNATGAFAAVFTVPDVTDFAHIRVVARASKAGSADGTAHEYLEVLPFLSIRVNPGSSAIKSEGSTPVTISVTSNDQPVFGVYVTATISTGGISATTGTTNTEGIFSLVFTAPLTTETLYATLTANARKDGYVDGSMDVTITVEPKMLSVQVVSIPDSTISEAKTNVTVYVTYETVPVEGAVIAVRAENGTFTDTASFSDINGYAAFEFTAPAVDTQTTMVLEANASILGYAGSRDQTTITVIPRTFNVTIQLTESSIQSGELASIIVNVTCNEDGKRVPNAWVAISCTDGNFSQAAKATDSNGQCSFIFSSPDTTAQITVIMTANVTKSGYTSNGANASLTVTPKIVEEGGGGFQWAMLLLVIIPVVIAVVIVVLIKLKVISVSSRDEE
jgi:hypothetical protein